MASRSRSSSSPAPALLPGDPGIATEERLKARREVFATPIASGAPALGNRATTFGPMGQAVVDANPGLLKPQNDR